MRPRSNLFRLARRPASLRMRLLWRLGGIVLLLLGLALAGALLLARADRRLAGLVDGALGPAAAAGRIQRDYNDSLDALTHAALMRLPSVAACWRWRRRSQRAWPAYC